MFCDMGKLIIEKSKNELAEMEKDDSDSRKISLLDSSSVFGSSKKDSKGCC